MKKQTIIQLIGAGIIVSLIACVVVVLVFKEEVDYVCNTTCAERQTTEIFGLVLSQEISENSDLQGTGGDGLYYCFATD